MVSNSPAPTPRFRHPEMGHEINIFGKINYLKMLHKALKLGQHTLNIETPKW